MITPALIQLDELRRQHINEAEELSEAREAVPAEAAAEKPEPIVRVEHQADGPAASRPAEIDMPPPAPALEKPVVSARTEPDRSLKTEAAIPTPVEESAITDPAPITEALTDSQAIAESEAHVPAADEAPAAAVVPIPETTEIYTLDEREILPPAPAADMAEAGDRHDEEVVFDETVMETFEELSALIELEREGTVPVFSDLETSPTDEIILLSQELTEVIEANKINAFEEFVMAEEQPEAVPDIETIIADADDRTPEATLVQLSLYLADSAETTEAAEAAPDAALARIEEILNDLAESLPPTGKNQAGRAEKPALTPELTQKLLLLLQAVGYDNPREALVGFIERNSFEFLLEAIRYLHQLADSANQQELSLNKPVNFTVMDVDEPLTARLGRAIMQRLLLPDTAILPA